VAKRFEPPIAGAGRAEVRRHGGTGLGLAISQRLVRYMQGEIGLDSRTGVGSTFWFTAVFGKQETQPPPVVLLYDLSEVAVLVVDDNPMGRRLTEAQLLGAGVMAAGVADMAAAVVELRQAQQRGRPYRAVFIDCQLPGEEAEVLIARLRQEPGLGDPLPLVMLSGQERTRIPRLKDAGAAAYLEKPLRQEALLRRLAVAIERHAERADGDGLAPRDPALRPASRHQPYRVLLAEDNPVNRLLAKALLQRGGYEVETVDNGQQAVEAVVHGHYDVVLMDVHMPEMDGIEATRRIRELDSQRRETPIVAMTANALEEDRQRCIAAGMNDYMAKPIDEAELLRILARWRESDLTLRAAS